MYSITITYIYIGAYRGVSGMCYMCLCVSYAACLLCVFVVIVVVCGLFSLRFSYIRIIVCSG